MSELEIMGSAEINVEDLGAGVEIQLEADGNPLNINIMDWLNQLGGGGGGAAGSSTTQTTTFFQSMAQVATLMPTASLLAFQCVSPLLSNQGGGGGGGGQCGAANRAMTAALVALCGAATALWRFADTIIFVDCCRDGNGYDVSVRYGVATLRGFWMIGGGAAPETAERYKLRLIDFAHAFVAVVVVAGVALCERNVVDCFYPSASSSSSKRIMFKLLPLGVVLISTIFFLLFPTKRRRAFIGFPFITTRRIT